MNRIDPLTQTMTTQAQTQDAPVETPETESLYMSVTPSLTPETSLRQRTASEAKTADSAVVAASHIFKGMREQAETIGVKLAVFCRLDRHGILGKLFSEDAHTAKALCEMRLNDLKEDLKTFSDMANKFNGRKDRATKMLAEMEMALTEIDEQPAAFLDLLAKYENVFGKVSFLTIMDARFMQLSGAENLDPRVVAKEGTFVSVEENMKRITAELGRVSAFEESAATEATIAEAELIQVTPGSELTEEALLEIYIKNNPALVTRMVTSWAVNELLAVETTINRGLAQSAIDIQPTPESIRNMLKASDNLKNDVMVEVSRLHTGRLFDELSDFDVETASVEELLAARQQCLVFNQLQKGFEGELSTSEVREQKEDLEAKQIEIAARMIELYAASEADKLAEDRLFLLGAPTAGQVQAKLAHTELMESTEKALYKNIISYMDASAAFAKTGDHQCLTTMQQARFDTLRSQQYKLVEEMEAKIAGTPSATVLGNGDFEKDMELLETIYQVRQNTAKYRPVETLGENIVRLTSKIIWRDELSLNDIKARLVHDYHLKRLGYSFQEEFLTLCSGSKETLGQVCTGLKDAGSKALEGVTSPTLPKAGLFQMIGLPAKVYNGIQETLGETLKEVLAVAERNPVAFRRMCGDFAQLVPQLKLLIGANTELTAVVDQISYRLTAESAASYFAGNKATGLDEEIDPKSDLARNLKRFQFFCDLSSGMLKGATGLNVITSAMSGPIGVAKALFNVGTMVVTREMINRMPAEEVQMLDKLFHYGLIAGWSATSPYDIAARAARNVGQNKGLVTSAFHAVFAPYIKRYNALTEAIMNVQNHKPGAWAELAFEAAKTTVVLAATVGTTCTAVAGLSLTGGVLVTTGAALTAAWSVASFSYGTAQLIKYLEENNILALASQTIEAFSAQHFSGNSKMAKSARLRCEKEAATITAALAKQDAYQQECIERAARKMYQAHWNQVAEQQSHIARTESYLNQSRESREEQAKELAKKVQVLKLVEQNLNKAFEISQSTEQMAQLQQQLKDLGVEQRAPEAGLAFFLLSLKQEMNTAILSKCGTETPGDTAEEIAATIAQHRKEVMLGSVVRETLKLKSSDQTNPEAAKEAAKVLAETAAAAKTEQYKLVQADKAQTEQQRHALMYNEALKRMIEANKAQGRETTVADLKAMDLEMALAPYVRELYKELKTVNGQCVEQFKAKIQQLPLFQNVTAATRNELLDAAAAA